MKYFLLSMLSYIGSTSACGSLGSPGDLNISAKRWAHDGDEGISIYYPKKYDGVPFSKLMLRINVSDLEYVTTSISADKIYEELSELDEKLYNVSHVYLSEKFLHASDISIEYDHPNRDGEPMLGCKPSPFEYKVSDLIKRKSK